MKGPYERLKYDLRRVWECPVCRHKERTGGDVTTQFCRCQMKVAAGERVAMKLAEDGPRIASAPTSPPTGSGDKSKHHRRGNRDNKQ